jgi:hypothetical protein
VSKKVEIIKTLIFIENFNLLRSIALTRFIIITNIEFFILGRKEAKKKKLAVGIGNEKRIWVVKKCHISPLWLYEFYIHSLSFHKNANCVKFSWNNWNTYDATVVRMWEFKEWKKLKNENTILKLCSNKKANR